MATEKLIVENFGPIQKADLDLRKVTVLVGEQASGKSVLAKLAAQFSEFSTIRGGVVSFNQYNLDGIVLDSFNGIDSKIKVSFKNEVYSINYTPNKVEHKREYLNKEVNSLLKQITFAESELNISENEVQYQSRSKILSRFFDKLYHFIPIVNYIPTERILIPHIHDLSELNLNLGLRSFINHNKRKAASFNKEINISFLKQSFIHRDGINYIIENGKFIELINASSGIQTVMPIVYELEYKNGDNHYLTVIEEPELSLFPTTQNKLVQYLIEKCTNGENRLIITTHSPYILTALSNLIEAKNVVKQNPELHDEVAKLIHPQYWLDFDDVSAYFVGDGTAKSIRDEENQNIDANPIDDVSNEMGGIFDKLLDLKYAETAQ
jgi:predicted ATPase